MVSGLLSGSFSLGGGVGPLLGGLLAAWLGFQWSAAAFGAVLAATGAAVCAVGALQQKGPSAAEGLQQSVHSTPSMPSVVSTASSRGRAHRPPPPLSPRPPLMSGGPQHAFRDGRHQADPTHEPLLGRD